MTSQAIARDTAAGGLSPELRDRLLYYAWRAPSPHNAQGWRIEADGHVFRVSRDPARQVLRDFDPEGRESDLAWSSPGSTWAAPRSCTASTTATAAPAR